MLARVENHYYDAGHTMYSRQADLEKLERDLAAWLAEVRCQRASESDDWLEAAMIMHLRSKALVYVSALTKTGSARSSM